MFDIIIRDGKKESYIKLNGNILEGFNALNGEIAPLTKEEVNTANLLKLSDDKSYLGIDNGYVVYLDNISGLKHYFKDEKEDFEATWEHNGEDALIYKGNSSNEDKGEVKNFQIKKATICITKAIFTGIAIGSLIGMPIRMSILSFMDNDSKNVISSEHSQETISYSIEFGDSLSLTVNTDEVWDNITYEQIESCIEENTFLTEEEKELVSNKKLLEDVVPYYENTNMNVLIPLKFDDLQVEYYYKEPNSELEQENVDNNYASVESAHYNELTPNILYVNTYFGMDDRYDSKAHEYIHLLQTANDYSYIREASAEIISCEYDDKCVNKSYLNPVKNTKILMEIIGPEPVWKLNFSGDDTDLVNIIRANLEEEQANELISLLKEKPGKEQRKGLDEDITALLSQMYSNMYGEDMRTNPFIDALLWDEEICNRHYFNSDKIAKDVPYKEEIINTLPPNYTFYYVYVFSQEYMRNDNLLDDIYKGSSNEVFMLSKEQIKFSSIKGLTKDLIEKNDIKFYYQGKELPIESLNLSKYENKSLNWLGGINPEMKEEIRRTYYPTIYESFPEQRIGANIITK